MTNFNKWLDKQMKDPDFKREFDSLEPEFEIVKLLFEAREYNGLTQKDLEERTGIDQATISKIETGAREPGIRTVQKIANGLGYTLKLEPIKK